MDIGNALMAYYLMTHDGLYNGMSDACRHGFYMAIHTIFDLVPNEIDIVLDEARKRMDAEIKVWKKNEKQRIKKAEEETHE